MSITFKSRNTTPSAPGHGSGAPERGEREWRREEGKSVPASISHKPSDIN